MDSQTSLVGRLNRVEIIIPEEDQYLGILQRCFPDWFKEKGAILVVGTDLQKYVPKGLSLPCNNEEYLEQVAYLKIPKFERLGREPRDELPKLIRQAANNGNIVAVYNPKEGNDRIFEQIKDPDSLANRLIGKEGGVIVGAAGPNVKGHGYNVLSHIFGHYIHTMLDSKPKR